MDLTFSNIIKLTFSVVFKNFFKFTLYFVFSVLLISFLGSVLVASFTYPMYAMGFDTETSFHTLARVFSFVFALLLVFSFIALNLGWYYLGVKLARGERVGVFEAFKRGLVRSPIAFFILVLFNILSAITFSVIEAGLRSQTVLENELLVLGFIVVLAVVWIWFFVWFSPMLPMIVDRAAGVNVFKKSFTVATAGFWSILFSGLFVSIFCVVAFGSILYGVLLLMSQGMPSSVDGFANTLQQDPVSFLADFSAFVILTGFLGYICFSLVYVYQSVVYVLSQSSLSAQPEAGQKERAVSISKKDTTTSRASSDSSPEPAPKSVSKDAETDAALQKYRHLMD